MGSLHFKFFSMNMWFHFLLYYIFVVKISAKKYDDRSSKFASDYILEGLNKDAKPCDKVFEFMCGKWLKNVPNKTETNYFYEEDKRRKDIEKVLIDAINDIDVDDKKTPKYKVWLRTFYDQCRTTNTTRNESLRQIYSGLERIIGPPPILAKGKTALDSLLNRNVWNLLGRIQRELGEGIFFDASVVPWVSKLNELKPVLSFFPQWNALHDFNETEIYRSVKFLSKTFDVSIDDDELNKKIEKLLSLESDISNNVKKFQNKSEYFEEYFIINSTTELIAINPKIDWQEYFLGLFSSEQLASWKQEKAKFQMKGKEFFQNLDEIINKYDKETLFDYIFCKTMRQLLIDSVNTDFSDGVDEDFCLRTTKDLYVPALAKSYFDYTGQNAVEWKSDLVMVVDTVFSAFNQIVKQATWLDAEEKASILIKAQSVNYYSPIPEWFGSDDAIEKQTIKFEPDKELWDNAVNIRRRQVHLDLDRLISEDPNEVDMNFLDYTYYAFMVVKVYLGTVLPPLYHVKYSPAAKYGILGTRIASILLQGFADDHTEEVPKGLKQWIKGKSLNYIDRQRNCLDQQIESLDCSTEGKVTICPGDSSLSWNYTLNYYLHDIDGLKIAYQAYKLASSKTESGSNSKPLNDLSEYNSDEIFFLSAGRSYCQSYFSDSIEQGGRSTTKSRLVRMFRNFPVFGKTFKCDKKSPLVVEKSCGIWGNN